MSKENGGSAFPQMDAYVDADGQKPVYVASEGMTLRDYFAAKAMQATWPRFHGMSAEYSMCAVESYKIADAMLAERSKP